jgi:hypothetical protein
MIRGSGTGGEGTFCGSPSDTESARMKTHASVVVCQIFTSPIRKDREMASVERRLILGAGAVLIMFVAIIAVVFLRLLLFNFAPHASYGDKNILPDDLGGYVIPMVGVLIAASPIVYLMWDKTNSSWRRAWLYTGATLVIGAFSLTNYWSDDTLVPISWQATMNIALAFSATVAISLLWDVSFSLTEAKILKYMSIAALCAFGVILPTIFDLAFFAIKLNIVAKDEALMVLVFAKDSITAICAIGGLALAVLKYLDERKKVATNPT